MFEEDEMEAAADALRRYEMVGRKVEPWDKLHRTSRKRWLIKVHVVLDAANKAAIAKANNGLSLGWKRDWFELETDGAA